MGHLLERQKIFEGNYEKASRIHRMVCNKHKLQRKGVILLYMDIGGGQIYQRVTLTQRGGRP